METSPLSFSNLVLWSSNFFWASSNLWAGVVSLGPNWSASMSFLYASYSSLLDTNKNIYSYAINFFLALNICQYCMDVKYSAIINHLWPKKGNKVISCTVHYTLEFISNQFKVDTKFCKKEISKDCWSE